MTDRLRVAVDRGHYSFCGFPLTDDLAAKWPPRIPIRDERDGTYVNRISRCTCGRPVLPGSLDGISCSEHDDDIAKAMQRHPAGKARTDGGPSLREYLESKGEL